MLIAATHPFINSLEHIAGFLVVLVVLTLLWVLTAVVGRMFAKFEASPAQQPQAPAVAVPSGNEPTEEEIVAVSACVAALMGKRSRVVSIRRAGDWHREGRREHFASHKIR